MSQSKRKAIPQKMRFEVFKRDSFKCQYCGQSSPDVILHVDHIKPVSKGGDNSIVNLITACQGCNSGKSNIELDDSSALAKQKAQMDELNERREQLQMMMDWRAGLKDMDNDAVETLVDEIESVMVTREVNEQGERSIRTWFKKYGYTLVSECIEISAGQYLKFDDEGRCEDRAAQKFFSMIPRIAANKLRHGDDPDMSRLYYARGILRNRLSYCNESMAIDLLVAANDVLDDPEELIEIAKVVKNWTAFRQQMAEIMEGGA
ncbi:HNH endonuclease [Marinobacter sp. OP 3.4]|uniref:HNH endonuclease n=1 Tax=Marinobacter sp. OP 3.4 TaxID=3076501 RepID=UPI002E1CC8D1